MAVALILPTAAWAANPDDPATRREQVRKERAAVASKLDVLRASDADVQNALGDLEANLSAQQAVVASAQQAADVADREHAAAVEAERRKAEELAAIRARMAKIAVEAYLSPLSGSLMTMLKSNNLSDATMKQEFLEIGANHSAEVAQKLKRARTELEEQRQVAEEAQRRTAERRAEVEQRLTGLRQAADQQRQVAAQVEGRIEASLAEASALSTVDNQLSAEISSRQAALVAKLQASSRVAEQASGGSGGGGGGGGAPRAPVSTRPVSVPTGNIALATVGGITVAASIAGQLESLLNAASADGISLSGSGYRDSSSQVALRQANGCPDIYDSPASSCRIPTARPGSSMHEQGLAIDFSYGGSLINSRSSPGFQWLAGNASSFGFFNLPAEPWHWSTNGN